MNPDEKPIDDKAEDELTPDEIDGGDPELAIPEAIRQVASAMDEAAERARQERLELFEGNEFNDGDLAFGSDLAAYDQAAYTRTKRTTDYSSYRYNLEPEEQDDLDAYSYEVDEYGNPLDPLLDADGKPVVPVTGKGSKGYKGGYGSYGSSWGGYGGSWGSWSGGWQSAWYSGYSSAERAIEGVHDHVETFIRAPGFEALEIIPDLEELNVNTIRNDGCQEDNSYSAYRYDDSMKTLVVRIDSCLYDKLGISEAQQHYIVDGISQVLAAQSFPDPFLVTLLQGTPRSFGTFIPNVVREITTEMMRAKGLSMLLEEMPGWLKRVNAFRSAMYVHEPKEGEVATAYLMYAVWEREVIETIEHQDAVDVINKIEGLLESSADYVGKYGDKDTGEMVFKSPTSFKRGEVNKRRAEIVNEINELLCGYITGFGPAGVIVKRLTKLKDTFEEKKAQKDKSDPGFWPSGKELVQEACDELMPLIHDHNRTFEEKPGAVKHQDAPECPSIELLSEARRSRVEFSRKCLFNFKRLPFEISKCGPEGNEDKYLTSGIKRIKDMLGKMGNMSDLLKDAEKILTDKYKGGGLSEMGDPERGNSATRHPELRSRSPIGSGTRRNFEGQDPDFNRPVIIFDSTLEA